MNSIYNFIVEPLGETYNNEVKVGDKNLILNTKVEKHKFVNNYAKVIAIPKAFTTPIKVGDSILIHHNVFRRWYGMDGKRKNGKAFFKDNLYFVSIDQIYLYKNKGDWRSINNRCFIKPIENKSQFKSQKEEKLIGVLKIGNKVLEGLGVSEGDLVGYKPYGEYDFLIDNERLYCMKSNDIVIKYEYQGNEKEYNPSWTSSG